MLAGIAFGLLGRLRIEGAENLPKDGPFLLVGNHFHYADPVALMWLCRRQVEFIGGAQFVFAPKTVHFLPSVWGYLPAHRGGYSRSTLKGALSILKQGGILALFPEGGVWAQVLRPARPGVAFLAVESGVPVVPVGLDGFTSLFKVWWPELTIRVGKPVGPFKIEANGENRRQQLAAIGRDVMRAIAELIPEERRGIFSHDPKLREEAKKVAAFPFEDQSMRGM